MDLSNHLRSRALGPVIAGLISLVVAGEAVPTVRACTTPVYRVAMYDWPSAPFYVFYFHQGPIPKQDQKVNDRITKAADEEAEPAPANVTLHVIDVAKEGELDKLPKVVQEAWKTHDEKRKEGEKGQPAHLVFTASGVEMYTGRLTEDEFAKMVDSPARQRLAKALHDGNAVVLLLLTAPDEKQNEKARKTIGEVIEEAAAGNIPSALDAFEPVAEEPDETPSDKTADDETKKEDADNDKAGEPKLKVATITVSRTDPAEKWLVRMLMLVEPDLHEYAKEPMVFAMYGRARALPPFITDRGITAENLTEAVMFVSGACSCTIKGQNPGEDLLVRWDWDATAEALAKSDPTLNAPGGLWGYEEFDPAASKPDEATPEDVPETIPGPKSKPSDPAVVQPSQESPAEAVPAKPERTESVSGVSDPEENRPDAKDAAPSEETAESEPADREATESFAARQTWTLVIGIGLVGIVILGAGLALLRRP